MKFAPRQRRAFTLVELLIVLAIVGILAAILFPVFSQARASARAASCASNLKQIGLGILQYAGDHNGLLPVPAVLPTEKKPRCGWPDHFRRYVRDSGVFQCPEDEEERAYDPACGAAEDAPIETGAGSYNMTSAYNRLKVITPTTLVLALDGRGSASSTGGSTPMRPQDITGAFGEPRHRGTYAILFGDGHVKRLPTDKMLNPKMWGNLR